MICLCLHTWLCFYRFVAFVQWGCILPLSRYFFSSVLLVLLISVHLSLFPCNLSYIFRREAFLISWTVNCVAANFLWWFFLYPCQMLATLLIMRQFLQNVKEVLQPYLYERHKLGELTLRAVWDLLLSVLLKYARLAAGKAQASPTDHTMPGPGLRGTKPGVGQPERRCQTHY